MKCILFSRVSTQGQDLTQQTQELKEEAKRLGYNDYKLIEFKESAVKLDEEERLGIIRLKEAIENDKSIDCVIIWEISRLSRRPKVLYSVRDYLIERNIQLICCKPYMRLLEDGKLSQTASIMFSLFASISESEMMIKKERFARARDKMLKEGKMPSGFPKFGYARRKDGYLEIVEEQAEIIREIYDRYENGESCGMIAKDLWMRNIWSTTRKNSIIVNVNDILRDQRYAGDNMHPAIITKRQYDRCREICLTHRCFIGKRTKTKDLYICSGLICTEGGYAMCGSKSNGRYVKPAGIDEAFVSIRMDIVDDIAIEVVKEISTTSNVKDIEKQRDELMKNKKLNAIRIDGIDRCIEDIKKENDRIEHRIIKGRLSESRGDKMIDDNMKKIYDLADEKDNLRYTNNLIDNHLITLSDPLIMSNEILLETKQQKHDAAHKYIKKMTISSYGYARYNLVIETKIGKIFKYDIQTYDSFRKHIKRIK